ncbi:YopX family protein, partial [Fusobacterium necrophorum]
RKRMREIKFRAWLKEKNKLVYPEWIAFFKDFAEFKVKEAYGYTVYRPNYKNIDIMQYTGLKDKNGKEIYEGDIVKVPHFLHDERIKINGVVKYVNNRAEFVIDLEDIEETFYCCNQSERIEVVGNIYENPELLEVEK